LRVVAALLGGLGLCVSCGSRLPASNDVVARVNGKDITAAQLDRTLRARMGSEATDPLDETDDTKLQILSQIISDELLLSVAAKKGLTVTDAEVESRFNTFRAQYGEEAFNALLARQKTTPDEIKNDMRRALLLELLIAREVTARIQVSNDEILDFYNRNKRRFDLPESFQIAHILVTSFPEAEVRNTKKDDAKNANEAREKAVRLLREVQGGADFGAVARDYSEDPTSTVQGGDLGFQTLETIGNIDPRLGQLIERMKPGDLWPQVVETRFGYHIIKLLALDPGGQKDLTDPRVQPLIHQELSNRKDRALKAALADVARNQAEVTNYLAERILASAGAGQPKR
jgi:peptidyl-prolyl cis-trans isomerase SurA